MNRKSVAGSFVFAAFVASLVVLVQAHMAIQKTEPADGATITKAPTSVQLIVSEKPDLAVTKVTLTGPSGKVELGPAHTMSAKTIMAPITGKMVDGKYSVAWQTAGDDGHVTKGAFAFTLKQGK